MLRLLGEDPDPARSREHMLPSILTERRLLQNQAAELGSLSVSFRDGLRGEAAAGRLHALEPGCRFEVTGDYEPVRVEHGTPHLAPEAIMVRFGSPDDDLQPVITEAQVPDVQGDQLRAPAAAGEARRAHQTVDAARSAFLSRAHT